MHKKDRGGEGMHTFSFSIRFFFCFLLLQFKLSFHSYVALDKELAQDILILDILKEGGDVVRNRDRFDAQ